VRGAQQSLPRGPCSPADRLDALDANGSKMVLVGIEVAPWASWPARRTPPILDQEAGRVNSPAGPAARIPKTSMSVRALLSRHLDPPPTVTLT